MGTSSKAFAISTLLSVAAVHAVSGFAQTNTLLDRDARRSSQNAVSIYVAERSSGATTPDVTSNISFPAAYRPLVATMLTRSATFRRQCARLAAASYLSIIIRAEAPKGIQSPALTRIRREADGRLIAITQLALSSRSAELLAHEFEHIIEQLDGVDLEIMSRLRSTGVKRVGEVDAFETRRAILTGLRVARESAVVAP
jgi:hypothetical protein